MASHVIRSMMSVPGIREKFIDKAREIPADILCFDLEDSVAWDDKPAARAKLAEVLPDFPALGRMLFVRVNGYDTGLTELELDAVVGPWLHGINISKVNDAADMHRVDHYLTFLEKTRGLEDGQIKLIPWIENATAVVNAYEICTASQRTIGAAIGGEDYAVSIGARRTRDGAELLQARSVTVNACHAAGIVPIDTPRVDFKDTEAFEDELQFVRTLGFRGKFCIHPTQVDRANEVFAPTDEDKDWARRVIELYEDGVARNLGAVSMDGEMIDKPVADQARALLEWVDQIEARGAPTQS
ncbi:MAG: CoA ester lyase [Chloroflexi bacterium]|nr:CoA ester lyase [Chloroflexota bacterium]